MFKYSIYVFSMSPVILMENSGIHVVVLLVVVSKTVAQDLH